MAVSTVIQLASEPTDLNIDGPVEGVGIGSAGELQQLIADCSRRSHSSVLHHRRDLRALRRRQDSVDFGIGDIDIRLQHEPAQTRAARRGELRLRVILRIRSDHVHASNDMRMIELLGRTEIGSIQRNRFTQLMRSEMRSESEWQTKDCSEFCTKKR